MKNKFGEISDRELDIAVYAVNCFIAALKETAEETNIPMDFVVKAVFSEVDWENRLKAKLEHIRDSAV